MLAFAEQLKVHYSRVGLILNCLRTLEAVRAVSYYVFNVCPENSR